MFIAVGCQLVARLLKGSRHYEVAITGSFAPNLVPEVDQRQNLSPHEEKDAPQEMLFKGFMKEC